MRKTILNSITCDTFYEPQKSGCAPPRHVLALAQPGKLVGETAYWVSGRAAISAAQKVFQEQSHIPIYIFKRLEWWHFDDHFYLAVFKNHICKYFNFSSYNLHIYNTHEHEQCEVFTGHQFLTINSR